MPKGLQEIELGFEPQEEGGYHVYAPELPGLHTQGDDLDDAMTKVNEAVASMSRDCVKTASRSIWA